MYLPPASALRSVNGDAPWAAVPIFAVHASRNASDVLPPQGAGVSERSL